MKPLSRHALLFIALTSFVAACKKDPVSFSPTNPVSPDYVHVANGQLLDSASQKLTLNGVNLGSWLIWEGWIWGGGLNSETWVRQTIAGKTSDVYAESFRQSIYKNFITRDDIKAISALGMNSIRVPFNHFFFDDGGTDINNDRFEILDSLLAWCEEFKIYVIPDFHALPGGENPLFISDPSTPSTWDSQTNKDRAANIWKAIARRYVNRKVILGYDLMNEPSTSNGTDMVNLYVQLVNAVRSEDPNHLLIIEGNNYAQDFSMFNTVLDNNQIFSFHFYPWLSSSSNWPSSLKTYDDFARKVKTPMWCGEWGEMSLNDLTTIKGLLHDTSYQFCGNAFWTWKKVKESGNSPVNGIVVSDDWNKLINGQNKSGSQTYEQIADSFLSSMLFVNTQPDAGMQTLLAP